VSKVPKIVIASNRFLIASGIGSFFKTKGYYVYISKSSQDALERLLITEVPDIVLIDDFEGLFKVEKTIAFLSFTKPAKMILVSDSLNKDRYDLLSKVGLKHYLSSQIKEEELWELFDSINNTLGKFVDSLTQERLSFNQEEEFRNTCSGLNISEREVEIIKLIAEGFINKEIADQLFLSTHTVNTHRKNIMSKLGVSNATGIVIFAVKEKLVRPKDFLFASKN
jgi:DNA-binding NarL/FixJ family response regulator